MAFQHLLAGRVDQDVQRDAMKDAIRYNDQLGFIAEFLDWAQKRRVEFLCGGLEILSVVDGGEKCFRLSRDAGSGRQLP